MNLFYKVAVLSVSSLLLCGGTAIAQDDHHDNRPQNTQQDNSQNRPGDHRSATNGQQPNTQNRPGSNQSGYTGQQGHDQNRPGDNRSGNNGQYSGNQGRGDNHVGPGTPGQPIGNRGYAQNGYVRHDDWRQGGRIQRNDWNRGQVVDYHHYHLRAPQRGYEWRQVDGNFVLAAVTTGVIASVIAASAARPY